VLEPNNRQGSMAPLVFGTICAVVGAVVLAFFINVGFGH
jgi:high-affinity Fe2+/Pb2+ permease